MNDPNKSRFHRIDGWRGYWMPPRALAGVSDTGTASDSPCPTGLVTAELRCLADVLKWAGIRYRMSNGTSSNVFCGKRWIAAAPGQDFEKAARFTMEWLELNKHSTTYIHDADLDTFGFRTLETA